MSNENIADFSRPAPSAPDQKQYRMFAGLAPEIGPLKQHGWRVRQLLNGHIRWLRERKHGAALKLREDSPAYGQTDDQLDELLYDAPADSASTLQPLDASTPS